MPNAKPKAIQLYYRCRVCQEFKPVETRARRYCSKACRAKAQYDRTGKEYMRYYRAKASVYYE